ncbi:MAG: hypothetical protein U0796_09880 [Gemmatales bacterium]
MTISSAFQNVKLTISAADLSDRFGEPVTCGIPWPPGVLHDTGLLVLKNSGDQPVPLQTTVLDRWKDGSIRWLLLDWQSTLQKSAQATLTISTSKQEIPEFKQITSELSNETIRINTGSCLFSMKRGKGAGFLQCMQADNTVIETQLLVVDEQGKQYLPTLNSIVLEEQGSLRTSVCLSGGLSDSQGNTVLADVVFRIHFFAGLSTVRLESTIRNPRKAEHPGGLWDLGNGGSVYFRDAVLQLSSSSITTEWSGKVRPEPGHEIAFTKECELYQDSSGGENWNSSNHVNRHGEVPLSFRGYRLRIDDRESTGLRASPSLLVQSDAQTLGIAVPNFWQNFPLAVEASQGVISFRLFPQQSLDVHEMQGGEQKSHVCYLAFGPDGVTREPLAWCHSPSHAAADPCWYASSGVVPYLTPRSADPHKEYLTLVDAALEGPDTFATKREVIDEYGWRHFGDIYGDHEAVFHKSPTPLVSHYNNQYDAVAGMGYQYLRSADCRWLTEMQHLARHVIDIDVYHTDQDKSAYNHGLFWHTFHYVDADTGTHRSYPRNARVPPDGRPVPGGGPANEQNYTTGLMLHYFLTGHRPSKETAIGLARWVIDMDDGTKTIFRFLSTSDTGLASKSRTPSYHGPGRGAANSIAALVDGHRLTGEMVFLKKAEQLIRRCIHPSDNVEQRNLLDAENRWFYTMFLQSLGKYLHYKQEIGELDSMYAYARASLLHYVRWMAVHEYPYLEKPEILEYPTETWAAQDMRKCEIFNLASQYTDKEEANCFRERADYFYRYSTSKLLSLPTRTLCRPVVLMLNYGFAHAWHKQNPYAKAATPDTTADFGQPTLFIPQKEIAIRRAKRIIAAFGVIMLLTLLALAYWLIA